MTSSPADILRMSCRVAALALALAGFLGQTACLAQEFPSRPLRLVVPQPPGGGFDLVGRVVGSKLSEFLCQQVVVENRTGAAGAALAQATGTRMLHVPYHGAQAAYQYLLSGRLDLFFDNAGTAKQYVDSAQVKAFAVSTAERFPGLPDLPTVNETGVGKGQNGAQ